MATDDRTWTDAGSGLDAQGLDRTAIRALTELLGDDRGALDEVVGAFVEEAPQRLAELRAGVARGDSVLAGRSAHTLKANSLTFGAHGLAALCLRLETAARANELAGLEQVLCEVDAEWARVELALTALVAAPRS
jgi:HPt (histidine-containing phosphotransfer) domain-containing protein